MSQVESSQEGSDEGPEPEAGETQKLKCEICGKEVRTSQALASHVRTQHKAEQPLDEIVASDEDRLRSICKRSGLASTTESVISIYFGENREGPQALHEVLKDLMVNSAKRRAVLRQYFQKPTSELGIAEYLDEESAKPKGLTSKLDEIYERRLIEAEIRRMEREDKGDGSSITIQLQKQIDDLNKRLVEEQTKRLEERINIVQKNADESSQSVIASVNKTMAGVVEKFTNTIKDIEKERQHQEELRAVRAESNVGERPVVTLVKTLDRTIREFPDSLVTAYRKLPMFPQPMGQQLPGQLPQQLPYGPYGRQMTEDEKLAAAKRLAEKATREAEAEQAIQQEQQAAQYRGYSEHNPFAAGGQG